jgi:hypothetical protein
VIGSLPTVALAITGQFVAPAGHVAVPITSTKSTAVELHVEAVPGFVHWTGTYSVPVPGLTTGGTPGLPPSVPDGPPRPELRDPSS